MQYGPEDLFLQVTNAVNLDHGRLHICALFRCRQGLENALCLVLGLGIGGYLGLRIGVDHRGDIRVDEPRVADDQRIHGAIEHLQQAVARFFLNVKHPQRRAPLARRLEGRDQDIAHGLFGQRRGVHDHGIQAARLCDQHGFGPRVLGERLVDDLRDLGRTSEAYARNAFVAGQRSAHGGAVAGQQLQCGLGQAGLAHELHCACGDQRRLFRWFCEHGIPCRQGCRNLTREDGQRKIPRRDADKNAARLGGLLVLQPLGFIGVIAQEVYRLANFGNAVEHSLACFARG